MNALSLTLLGPFQLSRDGRPLSGFESAKVRALLAFLAVESGRAHSRGALAALLWPEQPERTARHSLSQALSNLRRVLGDHEALRPVLELTRATLRFDPSGACSVDALQMVELLAGCPAHRPLAVATCGQCARQLEHGVGLYGGGFLEGLSLDDSPTFEEWAAHRREGLARAALQGLQTLGDYALARGEYEGARAVARRQVELDPLHEPGHRQLMEAHARSGRRAAALRQYRDCARLLDLELGVTPAPETQRLYEEIKAHSLEALPGPLQPNAHPFSAESVPRHAAPVERPLFVGREADLARLDQLLAQAIAGQGQVIFVTGETGSGKTALLHELACRAMGSRAELLVAGGNCNAHTGRGDPYLPFRELIGLLAGELTPERGPCSVPQSQVAALRDAVPLVAQALVEHGPELLGSFVATPALAERATALAVAPGAWLARLEELAARRTAAPPALEQLRLFEQVSAVLGAIAARRPLLLLLDDLQWADAGSIALLFHLGRALATSRILLVGAYRPEEVARGRDRGRHPLEPVIHELRRIYGHAAVDLDRSAVDEGRAFVDALLDSEPNALGPAFRTALLQQTHGHPLFTVELLRDMQARGNLVRDSAGRWQEGPALDWETLPARVEGAIAERIGRLDEAEREALLVASVEGESFTAEAIARVQAAEERAVVRMLSGELDRQHRLVSALGVRQIGERRLSAYSFRHILFQRYLYSHLDSVERAYLHEEVGSALEALYGQQTREIAVQLGRHFEKAGNAPKAIAYLRQAGDRAMSLAAYEEAIALFDRALALLELLPTGPARDRQELALQVARAVPLAATGGYAHPDVERAYARARALSRSADRAPERFAALWGLFSYYLVRAEVGPMGELAAQLQELAGAADAPPMRLVGHWAMGVTKLYVGEPAAALAHLSLMASLYDPARPAPALLFATDPGVACRFWSAWALWLLGRPDEALSSSYEALARAEQLDHPFSMAYALFTGTALLQFRREAQQAMGWAEATTTLAARYGFSYFQGLGTVFCGWAIAEQGRLDEGTALMEQGVAAARATGARIGLPHMLALLAEAYGRRGDPQRGLRLLDEALSLAETTGEQHYAAELHRLCGELLLAASHDESRHEQAERWLRRAVGLARSQGARALELRALISLCRLLAAAGRLEDELRALEACSDAFVEGAATADLREAHALIEQLRPAHAA